MKKYTVRLPKRVAKQIEKTPQPIQTQILQALTQLETTPRPHSAVVYRGRPSSYRLRFQNYRLIYEVKDQELSVLALRVGHRREVYRNPL